MVELTSPIAEMGIFFLPHPSISKADMHLNNSFCDAIPNHRRLLDPTDGTSFVPGAVALIRNIIARELIQPYAQGTTMVARIAQTINAVPMLVRCGTQKHELTSAGLAAAMKYAITTGDEYLEICLDTSSLHFRPNQYINHLNWDNIAAQPFCLPSSPHLSRARMLPQTGECCRTAAPQYQDHAKPMASQQQFLDTLTTTLKFTLRPQHQKPRIINSQPCADTEFDTGSLFVCFADNNGHSQILNDIYATHVPVTSISVDCYTDNNRLQRTVRDVIACRVIMPYATACLTDAVRHVLDRVEIGIAFDSVVLPLSVSALRTALSKAVPVDIVLDMELVRFPKRPHYRDWRSFITPAAPCWQVPRLLPQLPVAKTVCSFPTGLATTAKPVRPHQDGMTPTATKAVSVHNSTHATTVADTPVTVNSTDAHPHQPTSTMSTAPAANLEWVRSTATLFCISHSCAITTLSLHALITMPLGFPRSSP